MQPADAVCPTLGRVEPNLCSKVEAHFCCCVGAHLWAVSKEGVGGADRDRTGDPLLAKQVLSQLSYSPM